MIYITYTHLNNISVELCYLDTHLNCENTQKDVHAGINGFPLLEEKQEQT